VNTVSLVKKDRWHLWHSNDGTAYYIRRRRGSKGQYVTTMLINNEPLGINTYAADEDTSIAWVWQWVAS
jgi:hypothetical protein